MADKLEQFLQALPNPDEQKLVGLEARVWKRIETAQSYAYFAALPIWIKNLPIATTLLIGGMVGAGANPVKHDLDVFSAAPSYSINNIMVPCCD